jgi:hypothetical protein
MSSKRFFSGFPIEFYRELKGEAITNSKIGFKRSSKSLGDIFLSIFNTN